MNAYTLFLYFIFEIIMVIMLLKCFKEISNLKSEGKINMQKISIIIATSLILLLNNIYNLTEIKVLCCVLIYTTLYSLYYKVNIKDSFTFAIILIIGFSIIELLLSLILLINVDNIKNLNYNHYYIKIIYSIFEIFLAYKVLTINKIKKIINKLINTMTEYINFEIILIITVFVLNCIFYFRSKDFNNYYYIYFIVISILLIILSTSTIIKFKLNIKTLQIKNDELMKSYNLYQETIDQFKELKHNLKNELFSIKTDLPEEKQKKINSLITKYYKNYDWLNDINSVPEGLQGLIFLKMSEAKQKDIKVNINSRNEVKIREKDYLDLCEILGIVLDNAIDAQNNVKNGIIVINISEENEYTKITIINKFNNSININKLGEKNYSTKKIKSGIGLNYMSKIKNKSIKTLFEIRDDIFIVKIVYNNNN